MVKKIVRDSDLHSATKKSSVYKKTGELAQYNFSQEEIDTWAEESAANARGETSLLIDQIIDAACKCASYQSMGAFSYFENEDLYHSSWQTCIEILRKGKYHNEEGNRSLYGFLHSVAVNNILNFKRDNVWSTTVQKSNKHCKKCPQAQTCNRKVYMADYDTVFDCIPRKELQQLNHKKYLIGHAFETITTDDSNYDDGIITKYTPSTTEPTCLNDCCKEQEPAFFDEILNALPDAVRDHVQHLLDRHDQSLDATGRRRKGKADPFPNKTLFLRTLFGVIEKKMPDNTLLVQFIQQYRRDKHNRYNQSKRGKAKRKRWWKTNGQSKRQERRLINLASGLKAFSTSRR
jgi:hypothetical protein